MNQNKEEYRKLARSFEAKFHSKQEARLLANLNKKNVKAFQITKETILEDIKKELSFYQNEKGDRLEKQEVEYVLELVRKELWGYGVLDDLIHEKEISDIKLYGADHVRVKQTGCRWDAEVSFEDDREYLMFVTKLLERNKVNLGKEGAEAAGLSKASMTGHKCWTSVHGESCEMALDKMADYISQAREKVSTVI